MMNLSDILDLSNKLSKEYRRKPSKQAAKKLEQVTQMCQDKLTLDAKDLLDKYPTEENRKLYRKIVNVTAQR